MSSPVEAGGVRIGIGVGLPVYAPPCYYPRPYYYPYYGYPYYYAPQRRFIIPRPPMRLQVRSNSTASPPAARPAQRGTVLLSGHGWLVNATTARSARTTNLCTSARTSTTARAADRTDAARGLTHSGRSIQRHELAAMLARQQLGEAKGTSLVMDV